MIASAHPDSLRTHQLALAFERQVLLELSLVLLRTAPACQRRQVQAMCRRLVAEQHSAWAGAAHTWQARRSVPGADPDGWCSHTLELLQLALTRRSPAPGGFSVVDQAASWASQALAAVEAQLARETGEAPGLIPGHSLAGEGERQLRSAWELLGRLWPEAAGCVTRLVSEVVWFSGDRYFSTTAPYAFGAIFVNPRAHWCLPHYLETLLHEGGHLELMAEQAHDPLLHNGAALASSPLRDDARPLSAVLHAVFVLTRMVQGHRRYLACGEALPDRNVAKDLLAARQRVLASSLSTLLHHAQPTARGEAFLHSLGRVVAATLEAA
ncbi:MAG: HEXXH motif-containing putative peptide modification protein [Deltaproteobacteria bacterium]